MGRAFNTAFKIKSKLRSQVNRKSASKRAAYLSLVLKGLLFLTIDKSHIKLLEYADISIPLLGRQKIMFGTGSPSNIVALSYIIQNIGQPLIPLVLDGHPATRNIGE